MSPGAIVALVVAGIFVLSLVGESLSKRKPKESHFKFARCDAFSQHTERTIEAWRNHKTKLFCQTRHASGFSPGHSRCVSGFNP